jgi:hypothetical protein
VSGPKQAAERARLVSEMEIHNFIHGQDTVLDVVAGLRLVASSKF